MSNIKNRRWVLNQYPEGMPGEGTAAKPAGGEVMIEPPADLAKNDSEPSARKREALRILADHVLLVRNL